MTRSTADHVQHHANARGRRTRTAVLEAARALIEACGFGALTMAAVAERAGVSRRAVYLHFLSRSDLVTSLFLHVAETEELMASLHRVHQAPDALAALDAWAQHEATYHAQVAGVLRALEHVVRTDADAAEWRMRIAEHQRADCRALAERLEHERRLSPGWTVDSATDMLWALTSTELLDRLIVDRRWSRENYALQYSQLLRAAFTG